MITVISADVVYRLPYLRLASELHFSQMLLLCYTSIRTRVNILRDALHLAQIYSESTGLIDVAYTYREYNLWFHYSIGIYYNASNLWLHVTPSDAQKRDRERLTEAYEAGDQEVKARRAPSTIRVRVCHIYQTAPCLVYVIDTNLNSLIIFDQGFDCHFCSRYNPAWRVQCS